ncbi:MAG: CoA pyrophosphatase [Desulfoprunum sp.]|nr:CoA pyrophosphatase [Desulfoprunum sp.]
MKKHEFERFTQTLPEVPGIYGREDFFNCAILVPFLFLQDECHLLFQKRASTIRQGSEICFPGGRFDPLLDSSYQDTALRETEEELGMTRERIRITGRLDTVVTPRAVIVEPFVGILEIESLEELRPDAREVAEIFTLPLAWFIETAPEIYHNRIEIQPSYVDGDGLEHILLPVDELGLPSRYKERRSEWTHKVAVYRNDKYTIWGLTAAIILGMIRKMS